MKVRKDLVKLSLLKVHTLSTMNDKGDD